MIRVLIVDDSATMREYLGHLLESDPQIRVVASAANGAEALTAAAEHRPDVITMDLQMPVMDGIEATRRLMESHPTPVVVVTAAATSEGELGIRALAAGALSIVLKPSPQGSSSADLIQTVKLMAEVRVVRRVARGTTLPGPVPAPGRRTQLVAIGASTGGPAALARLLSALPADLPFPLVVVQHITAGFLPGLVDWLGQSTPLRLCIASEGRKLLPGWVYFAPDGRHLGIVGGRTVLSDDAPDQGLRPSVAHLFRSVRQEFGAAAAAVLLTGMGRDGAEELRALRDLGSLTLAQDEESSVVHGMPGAAIQLGAAVHILSPEGIGEVLAALGGGL